MEVDIIKYLTMPHIVFYVITIQERESKLLEIKITEIEVIVNHEINHYIDTHTKNLSINCKQYRADFKITSEIRKNTLDQLYHLISKWNGVDISRTKSALTRYRDYFCVAKNWWDQTKKKLFGAIFWLVIFKYIQKVSRSMFQCI